ncbi:hypothetical protein O59_000172 [Cellvibrio sp. BR]|nr:hypothetical protein O59_000172 [Cellvibrio sp. BR]
MLQPQTLCYSSFVNSDCHLGFAEPVQTLVFYESSRPY